MKTLAEFHGYGCILGLDIYESKVEKRQKEKAGNGSRPIPKHHENQQVQASMKIEVRASTKYTSKRLLKPGPDSLAQQSNQVF